jgi:predicted P-loop ATPase
VLLQRVLKNDTMYSNSISKDTILNNCNILDIYTKFLGLQSFPEKNISSPFSTDKNPSFKVYKNGTFKCNSSGKQGDVFQFVADLNQLDCKNHFNDIAKIIAKEMNIDVQNDISNKLQNDISNKLQNANDNILSEHKPSTLTIEKREFTSQDLDFWGKLGVEKNTLEKFKIYSVYSYTWTGKKPIYTKKEGVCFGMELEDQNKIYRPHQPDIGVNKNVLPAFKTGIFGLEQLGTEKKESIIICEGEKDTVVAHSRNFNTVSFGSCTRTILQKEIEVLQNHCNNLFICYDNDEPGIKAVERITKSFPQIIPLHLPKNENIKGYDITDYFQEYSAADFQKIIDLAVKKNDVEAKNDNQITTILHVVENYLNENYDIRHNIIANEVEMSAKSLNEWMPCNENELWREMQKLSIKVPASTLEKILKSNFVPKFNPLLDYFENLKAWDGHTDYIKEYAKYVTLATGESRDQFDYHFKKWCVRSVKCATDDNYFNKNAFVLSDDGKGQNIGKTTWIRNLCPNVLSNYLVDNLPKDEKDAKIVLTQNFIINLDELAALSKQEINTLKSLFSADKIKVRFPYDKKDTVVRRVGNFIGSTNQTTFLHDETGSVRWLCFVADKIDFSYKENFNINNLWSQAFALANDKNFEEKLTADDIKINEIRNSKFQIQTPEIDLINKYLEIPTAIEEAELISATEIQCYLNGFATQVRLTPVGVGKALKCLGFTHSRTSSSGLWVVKKKENNP